MNKAQKEDTLSAFYAGALDVLVATTVIEVGVNVPNATVMVIEGAERFGLAQLHQLRGRVGRGAQESWCFLMAEPNERLKTLVSTNDGFVVAQKDLELRGAGEFFGTRQHGEPQMPALMLTGDVRPAGAHTGGFSANQQAGRIRGGVSRGAGCGAAAVCAQRFIAGEKLNECIQKQFD